MGADPGINGGIALINETTYLSVVKTPRTENDVNVAAIRDLVAAVGKPDLIVIESVHAFSGQGVSSCFQFGKVFGQLLGLFGAMNWPYQLVTPQAWKKVVLAGTDKSKEAANSWAAHRFPGAPIVPPGCRKPHDGCSEALAMAYYCREVYGKKQ
jgi:crossover junction endodeoxyribonuclease RuvC